jgi:hypothetical protein
MERRDSYELDSFYPKAHGFITSRFEDGYLRFVTTEEEYVDDAKIDNFGGRDLRLTVARRSRGNKKVLYDGKSAEVTYFRISRARNLLRAVAGDVKGKRILDMSAGWGDRLIAALQLGAIYTGVDPSSAMAQVYANILQAYPSNGSSVTTVPFEDFVVPEKYHVAFSSPPYYDVEIYNDETTQSIERYPSYETWMCDFLLPCLAKMVESLLLGGYLILHLGDTKSVPLAEASVLYLLQAIPTLRYIGVIGVGNEKVSRPVWIFQLQEESVIIPYFRTYYPILAGKKLVHRESPPPSIIQEGHYTIYSDHNLVGGSKSRALHYLVQHNCNVERFIYAGPVAGLACVALAAECAREGKSCLLYLQGEHAAHENLLHTYGAKVIKDRTLAALESQASEACTWKDYLVPFGLDNVVFNEHFTRVLRQALVSFAEPTRCWLACGSGVLLRCLAAIWKRTVFCVVTVGKPLYKDTYPDEVYDRLIIYHYPDVMRTNFLKPAAIGRKGSPSIPKWTIAEYDAKAYHLMTLHFEKGDVMWNVGK